jgi:hemerythrin-like metal-binding protein
MALLRWTKKYSVSVKAFDDQHTEIIGILNELHAAMLKGQARDVAGQLVPRLKTYASSHFSTEERLMEETKFPGLAEHRIEHRALTSKVEEYVARYKQGDQTMYPQLLRFVGSWLHDHMLTVDKQYTAWMNNHGIH